MSVYLLHRYIEWPYDLYCSSYIIVEPWVYIRDTYWMATWFILSSYIIAEPHGLLLISEPSVSHKNKILDRDPLARTFIIQYTLPTDTETETQTEKKRESGIERKIWRQKKRGGEEKKQHKRRRRKKGREKEWRWKNKMRRLDND